MLKKIEETFGSYENFEAEFKAAAVSQFGSGWAWLVEDKEGKLVALSVCMPSIARAVKKGNGYLFPFGWWYLLKSMFVKYEEALELLLIAVDPDYRNKGVIAILFNEIIPCLINNGFKYAESNAEMETNHSVQNLWNDYRRDFKRRRRVFTKEI